MHRCVCDNDEGAGKDAETHHIRPEVAIVKAKRTENRGSGDLNIETVLVIDKGEILDFIDNE